MSFLRLDFADDSAEIGVSVNEAFSFFKRLENWPSWTKSIKRASRKSDGDWRVGFQFVFVAEFLPLPITAKVIAYEENRQIAWGLRTPVASLVHSFSFEPVGEGRCRVHQAEFAEGLLALVTWPLRKRIAAFDRQIALDFQSALYEASVVR